MGVEPAALGVGDDADDVDAGLEGNLRAQESGIFGVVVAGDDQVVLREELQHGDEGVDVLFLLDFAEGEEEVERLGVGEVAELSGLLLHTDGEVLDSVVDDTRGFPAEVDDARGVFLGKARDEGELGGAVAHALQLAAVFVLFVVGFFVEEVDVVDGEDEACAFAFGAEGGGLVDGVPDVEVGHGAGKLAVDVVTFDIVDIVTESTDVVLGDKKRDVEFVGKGSGVALIPAAVVYCNLAQPAHGVAEYAQIYEYLLFSHILLVVELKCKNTKKK